MEENVKEQIQENLSEQAEILEDGSSEPINQNQYFEFDPEKLTDEEKERIEEINSLLKAESLDTTTAMNIIINAVQVSYDKDHFNDLDRYLIVKALTTFKEIADRQEDIVVKTV